MSGRPGIFSAATVDLRCGNAGDVHRCLRSMRTARVVFFTAIAAAEVFWIARSTGEVRLTNQDDVAVAMDSLA